MNYLILIPKPKELYPFTIELQTRITIKDREDMQQLYDFCNWGKTSSALWHEIQKIMDDKDLTMSIDKTSKAMNKYQYELSS